MAVETSCTECGSYTGHRPRCSRRSDIVGLAVVDPQPMAPPQPQTDILRDVKPGQLVRLLLVGGGDLQGEYQGYTDELDHTLARLRTREGPATIRVAHVAGVVEIDGR